MEKYFKLSAAPYKDINAIRVYSDFNKRQGGYTVTAETVMHNDGMLGKCFCREYYEHDGDGIAKVIPAGRRSPKREAEAADYCRQNAREIAERYLKHIVTKLNISDEIKITEEE